MGGMDKSRELYSKEGDNSSRFEGKTVPLEHTIQCFRVHDKHNKMNIERNFVFTFYNRSNFNISGPVKVWSGQLAVEFRLSRSGGPVG